MKKKIIFFLKLFVVCVLLFVFSFVVVTPQYSGNYQASMVDKVHRLDQMQGKKIVLIGNSNLAFGMDSKQVEQAFGIQTINMGLHGGVGNAFNEAVAKRNVCEGDVYVIVHDNFSDNDTIKNPELAWITIENHFEMWNLIRWKDIPKMAEAFPTYLHKCINMWADQTGNTEQTNAYRRSAFNEYGDNIYPRPQSEGEVDFSPVKINWISEDAAKRINKLNAYLTSKGATLVIAGYPIAVSDHTPTPEEYAQFQEDLQSKLDCPVISDYNEYRMEPGYFYDSYLHMTDAGIARRTGLLIQDLQKYFDQNIK